ncbi:hypothetical protein V6259_02605 [Marinomonas sp. TI.3.20]|uniref:hypothetical protein n=1 Tax=Marinomonas sp. TI.3.20 TaxID=3121296 RepID=UPI00311D5965
MYKQVEKTKENKSRAVANLITQKKRNVKQCFGFMDNRPEAIAQRKFQSITNSHSGYKYIQKKPCDPVAQLKLPQYGEPDTKEYYEPINKSKSVAYSGGRPANFSTLFKLKMVQNEWGGSYNQSTDMWHVVTSGESQVVLPTNAIQIDHVEPWVNIEADLKKDPSTIVNSSNLSKFQNDGLITPDHKNYSVYAARKYYHDVGNLKPMAGSENASKGKGGSGSGISVEEAWANRVARSAGVHHQMIQGALKTLSEWGDAQSVTDVFGKIDEVDHSLMEAEDYFQSY